MANDLVQAISRRADPATGFQEDNTDVFAIGSKVQIKEGSLSGIEAIFAGNDGESRAMLMIELLGRSNKISVPRECLAKAA